MQSLSIVIPTYNRRDLVEAAVESGLAWLDQLGAGEIIIVDDASTDGTAEHLRGIFAPEFASGRLLLEMLPKNAGVTAAKNAGASLASHEWIVFLDSDDLLIDDAPASVLSELKASDAPVTFFRCVDLETGSLVGERPPVTEPAVGLPTLLSDWKWGECLPIVRRDAAQSFPYAEELRGYEGIAYARMVKHLGDARVSGTIARRYHAGDHVRETTTSRVARWRRHKRFTEIMLTEFRAGLSLRMRVWYMLSYFRARFDGVRAAFSTPSV